MNNNNSLTNKRVIGLNIRYQLPLLSVIMSDISKE